jgi:rubrerythrin
MGRKQPTVSETHAAWCREQKHKHDSSSKALKARKEMIRRVGDPARKLQAYFCDVCGAWHLGTPRKKDVPLKKSEQGKVEDNGKASS